MPIQLENTRAIQDVNFTTSIAFGAAGAGAVTSPALNLIQSYAMSESYNAVIIVPALPNNVTPADSPTVTLVDSADGVNFAAIPELAPLTVTGVAETGSAAVTETVKLPPSTRQYLGVQPNVPAGGGNNTASSVTLQLLF